MTEGGYKGFLVSLSLVALSSPQTLHAQQANEFYRGKTLTIIIGSGSSGGSDVFTRIFTRYLSQHLPGNPRIIVQNSPAAGGVLAAQEIANTAPRDGTVIASVQRGIPLMPLLSDQKVNYDSLAMNWIGSLNRETNVIVTWGSSPSKTIEDIFSRRTVVGTGGYGSDTHAYTLLLNRTLGTKFDLVSGYKGGPEVDLAMERGEIEGRVSITWTSLKAGHADWLNNKRINIVAQMALKRDPELPDIPNILEIVRDPRDRQVFEFLFARQEAGRPYVAPPNLPPERLKTLRSSFSAAASDPDFIKEITARGGSVELMEGAELQDLIERLYKTPPDILKSVKQALEP